MLELRSNDQEGFSSYQASSASPAQPAESKNARKNRRSREKKAEKEKESKLRSPPTASATTEFISEDDEQRTVRVFADLESWCVTEPARQSLWAFQLSYARQKNWPSVLPEGGRMVEKTSMFASLGRKGGKGVTSE